MVSRNLFVNELKDKWPHQHWDHWMRESQTNKGRDCLFPQVPRVFHNGIKGTFMNLETHNQYFKSISNNRNEQFRWDQIRDVSKPSSSFPLFLNYEKSIYNLKISSFISTQSSSCLILESIDQLFDLQGVCLFFITSISSYHLIMSIKNQFN